MKITKRGYRQGNINDIEKSAWRRRNFPKYMASYIARRLEMTTVLKFFKKGTTIAREKRCWRSR